MAYTILLNKIKIGNKAPTAIYKGGTEVKCVYKGSTLVYDTQKSSTTTNTFYFEYPSNYIPHTAEERTPSIVKGYNTTATGHSGATYDRGFTSVSSSVTFTASGFSSGTAWGNGDASWPTELPWGSVNSSTGKITLLHNRYTSSRSATITGKCTINGTSMSCSRTITQVSSGYKITVNITNYTSYRDRFKFFFSTSPNHYAYTIDSNVLYPINSSNEVREFGNSEKPGFYLIDELSMYPHDPEPYAIIYLYSYYQEYSYSSPIIVSKDSIYQWQPNQNYTLTWYQS